MISEEYKDITKRMNDIERDSRCKNVIVFNLSETNSGDVHDITKEEINKCRRMFGVMLGRQDIKMRSYLGWVRE